RRGPLMSAFWLAPYVAAAFDVEACALTLYRGAGTALESLPDIARRAASYRSQSALSASEGMVTTSPWSRPASAASTMSSADITIAAGRWWTGTPAAAHESVAGA